MENFQLFHVTCKGLIFYKNSFLLHRASDPEFFGALECPGGRVDKDELLEDVLKRELLEETGIEKNQISDIRYKDFLENFFGSGEDKHHELNMIFTANIDETLEIKSKEGHINFEWVDMNKIPSINFLPKEMISKL